MSKKSGAGINIIFLLLTLLLVGALAAIGVYTYFHESEREAKPASAPASTASSENSAMTSAAASTVTTSVSSAATTSVSTTSASTTASADRLSYHAYNETITEKAPDAEYVLSSEDSGDLLHIYSGDKWTLSDFNDSSIASVSKDKDASSFSSYINSTNVTESKSDIGISAKIKDGKKLTVESYGGECTDLRIVSNNDKYADVSFNADLKKGTLEADLTDSSFCNGLYVIHGEYSEDDKTYPINVYLYVNCRSNEEKDFNFYLCSLKQGSDTDDASAPVTTASTDEDTESKDSTTTTKA